MVVQARPVAVPVTATRAGLLTLAFLLELAVLAATALAAYRLPVPEVLRIAAAAAAVVAMAALGGLFAAPRASRRLSGRAGASFRLGWFGVGALAAGWALGPAVGITVAALCVGNALALRTLDRSRSGDHLRSPDDATPAGQSSGSR